MPAKDYARKTRAPRAQAKKPSKAPIPGWVWMFVGLLAGLFVAFLVFLSTSDTNGRQVTANTGKKVEDTRAVRTPKAEPPPAPAKLNFDFYSILPEFEVPVPREEQAPKRERSREASVPTPTPIPTIEAPGRFVLQAGSFRDAKDADSRRAQLALLGIISSVQTITIDGKQTWHRVRIGPYQDMSQVNRMRGLLNENGIEYLLVREHS